MEFKYMSSINYKNIIKKRFNKIIVKLVNFISKKYFISQDILYFFCV